MNNAKILLLSEGIATYFGGSNGQEYEIVKSKFFEINYPLDRAKIEEICKFPNQMNYYALGSILCELVINEKQIDGIKKIWDTRGSDDRSNGLQDFDALLESVKEVMVSTKAEIYEKLNDLRH